MAYTGHRPPSSLGGRDTPKALLPNGVKRNLFLEALPHILQSQAGTASVFLTASRATHDVVCAYLYHDVDIEVAIAGTLGQPQDHRDAKDTHDCCPGSRQLAKLYNVLSPNKYAAHVRVLRFHHPCPTHAPLNINEVTRASDRIEAWALATDLLAHCPRIVELVWETGFGVNTQMWKAISGLADLRRLHLRCPPPHPAHLTTPPQYPRLTPGLQQIVPPGLERTRSNDPPLRAIGREGLALGTAWEGLEELSLESLSVHGAWTLASHLQLLTDRHDHHAPRLHTLSLSTHFVDLRLCREIGRFGALRSLRHITLSTTGTKLNADCLKEMIEGCKVLESFKLSDVEGRLDKNTWSTIIAWPETLHTLEIDIAETGQHHSWVLKHLGSIHDVPLSQLKRFAVRRLIHPVATLPFPPPKVVVPVQLATHQTTRLPAALLDAIVEEGQLLEELCLDWWEMSLADLEAVLMACPRLRKLQVAVKAPVLDIVGMTTAFGNVPDLAELAITSDPKLCTAAGIKAKPAKKRLSDSGLPPFLADKVAESDPTLVEVRDLRKFARRLPEFRVLRWIGREGKGEWRFTNSKKTTLTPVDFVHAASLTKRTWVECQREPPSFEFDDDDGGSGTPQQLQVPVSPERISTSEFPALSRTNTSSSSVSTLTHSPTTPIAPLPPPMRRSSSSISTNNPLGLEWDPLPAKTATATSWAGPGRKPAVTTTSSTSGSRSEPPPPSRSSERARNRSRRESRARSAHNNHVPPPPPSPQKEPRHVPGSAPRKPPPSPKKDAKDKETKAKRATEDGWTTVGADRGRKK